MSSVKSQIELNLPRQTETFAYIYYKISRHFVNYSSSNRVLFKCVVGNFMYFASTTPYMIVYSRLIVGVSAGVGASIISMLTRAVEPEERTSLISRIFTGRQAGALFGPAFNFFLIYLNFDIYPFHVNRYTSPGVSIKK